MPYSLPETLPKDPLCTAGTQIFFELGIEFRAKIAFKTTTDEAITLQYIWNESAAIALTGYLEMRMDVNPLNYFRFENLGRFDAAILIEFSGLFARKGGTAGRRINAICLPLGSMPTVAAWQ
jgi:hypothetical protein